MWEFGDQLAHNMASLIKNHSMILDIVCLQEVDRWPMKLSSNFWTILTMLLGTWTKYHGLITQVVVVYLYSPQNDILR